MQIRPLQENELPLLFKYSSLEGWENEEVHTTALFHTHPQDFLIAYKEKKLIGFILAIKYSLEFGFVSNLLVLKEFRSCGYGKELFSFALEHLKGCQIALDSVKGKEKLYEGAGFSPYFDVITYRFLSGSVTLPSSAFTFIDFDKNLSLKKTDAYMKEMILSDKTDYKAIKTGGSINSFALSFKYKNGYKIHIESEEINASLALFFALIDKHKSSTAIYLQVSPLSPMLEAIAEALKMQVDTAYTRMYNFLTLP